MADFDRDSMLEMFIFEMSQLIEQLEQVIVQSESEYNNEQVNEIFRIMHTIKGSSAMMLFDEIARVAHVIEDLFYFLREENPKGVDFPSLSDLVLSGADFIKAELVKIQSGQKADGDSEVIAEEIRKFLARLKNKETALASASKTEKAAANVASSSSSASPNAESAPSENDLHRYKARITFEDGCEMENIRAYTLTHNLEQHASDISHVPEDVIDEATIDLIREVGFYVEFSSDKDFDEIEKHLYGTVYLKTLELDEIEIMEKTTFVPNLEQHSELIETSEIDAPDVETAVIVKSAPTPEEQRGKAGPQQTVISVNVAKLDALLSLMGELVIAEAMVTQNSELDGLALDSFNKEARQLRKIITNLRETVMSMRMVSLSSTFFKMHRIVRDMCRALDKDVALEIIGEDTEVDKNIIEHITDPIMHIIRNSIDHGIETPEQRMKTGKPAKGKVILQAKHSGSDVLIIVQDDGRGLNREKILEKARDNGLLRKPESEYTDKEIHQFIFMPGFSTNSEVTSYSGRGVGMDVVTTNLEPVGGITLVDSMPGEGSSFTLKIPLTLAIIEGMTITIAGAKYTIPIASIKRSFKPKKEHVFSDPDGNEMITDRGEIYNIVRLYDFFDVDGAITDLEAGILMQLENGDQYICLLVDELLGEQQAVVQSMPKYFSKVRGLSGCTLLGNGDISLIIDVAGFFDK